MPCHLRLLSLCESILLTKIKDANDTIVEHVSTFDASSGQSTDELNSDSSRVTTTQRMSYKQTASRTETTTEENRYHFFFACVKCRSPMSYIFKYDSDALMHLPERVELYDTTLRDGAQTAGISFSVSDKIRIAHRLAEFGIDWIEGGWPGASPKDDLFFEQMRQRDWSESGLTAFGSTARPGRPVELDPGLKKLINSGADAVCIFGKSWDLHATTALGISLEENLSLVHDSVAFLKQHFETVMFDAEHFFDGFAANENYAMQVLTAAADASADRLVLCDTNGGSIPFQIFDVVARVKEQMPRCKIGIHAHNDCEMAVANSVSSVRAGADQ